MLPLLFSLLAFTPDATPLARAPSHPTPRLVAKLSPHPLPRPSHTPLARRSAALLPALAALTPIAVGAVEPPFGVDTSFLASDEMKQLAVFLAQTVISWGVPGSLLILIIVLISGSKGDPTEAAAAASAPLPIRCRRNCSTFRLPPPHGGEELRMYIGSERIRALPLSEELRSEVYL